MASGSLIVISAPSGAGKTSLTRAVIAQMEALGYHASFSVSYTTREPRPGETDGVDYHFVTPAEFESMIERGEFLEHAEVFGRRYGTGRAVTEIEQAAGRDVILDIDWQGARQIRNLVPGAISIFILPPLRETLEARLRGRGQDSDETIAARMDQATREISHWDEYDYLVVNDDFDHATEELLTIFRAQRLRRVNAAEGMAGEIARRLSKPG